MYTMQKPIMRNVSCNATTRREKHSNLRKKNAAKRKAQDQKLRASFGAIAKDERERISSIVDAHREFFAREQKNESTKVVDPIVVDDNDLNSANGFFEE